MRAIPLSNDWKKLKSLSRELFLKHGWEMPRGYGNKKDRDPRNFTLLEWQQAKRRGKHAAKIKQSIQDCWAASDTRAAFAKALKEQGYVLANGERGYVVVAYKCEIYSVARQLPKGINKKHVEAKLGSPNNLPSAKQAKTQIAEKMHQHLNALGLKHGTAVEQRLKEIEQKRTELILQQQAA